MMTAEEALEFAKNDRVMRIPALTVLLAAHFGGWSREHDRRVVSGANRLRALATTGASGMNPIRASAKLLELDDDALARTFSRDRAEDEVALAADLRESLLELVDRVDDTSSAAAAVAVLDAAVAAGRDALGARAKQASSAPVRQLLRAMETCARRLVLRDGTVDPRARKAVEAIRPRRIGAAVSFSFSFAHASQWISIAAWTLAMFVLVASADAAMQVGKLRRSELLDAEGESVKAIVIGREISSIPGRFGNETHYGLRLSVTTSTHRTATTRRDVSQLEYESAELGDKLPIIVARNHPTEVADPDDPELRTPARFSIERLLTTSLCASVMTALILMARLTPRRKPEWLARRPGST